MTPKVNRDKSFLLEWIILHGDNWVFHNDIDMASYRLDICRKEKYIEETDILPPDDERKWGSYFRITKKGRDYATMR
jgi:hypothetical protein